MHDRAYTFDEKLYLDYLILKTQYDSVSFVGRHEYCGHDCDFGMQMRTSRRLSKKFIEELRLSPRDSLGLYVLLP